MKSRASILTVFAWQHSEYAVRSQTVAVPTWSYHWSQVEYIGLEYVRKVQQIIFKSTVILPKICATWYEERNPTTRCRCRRRCYTMVYWTYDSLSMFQAPLCPSSGAWDYTGVHSMWHITFVVAGRGSGVWL